MQTLGVLGGMGPAACAEFLRILARDCPAENDSQHPKIIMLSDPETPDRSNGIMGLGPDPEPVIKKNLLQLVNWGADVLAVPCNTAHYFIDHFRDELPVPLIHIVEATVEAARELSQGNCSWLLATDGTQKSLIYPTCAEKMRYHFLKPVPEQLDWIRNSTACRAAVKAGDEMKPAEMQLFAEKLLADESVKYCPHGRPVLYELSRSELEKQFGRLQ